MDICFRSFFIYGFCLAPEKLYSLLHAFGISFLLARHPGGGAYAALAVICMSYGRGFEAGYLILKPLAFYLAAVGTFIDAMLCSLASYAIAQTNKMTEENPPAHFI